MASPAPPIGSMTFVDLRDEGRERLNAFAMKRTDAMVRVGTKMANDAAEGSPNRISMNVGILIEIKQYKIAKFGLEVDWSAIRTNIKNEGVNSTPQMQHFAKVKCKRFRLTSGSSRSTMTNMRRCSEGWLELGLPWQDNASLLLGACRKRCDCLGQCA